MRDEDFLLRARKVAQIRQGFCAPNPSVGAVVVKDQRILAEGFHMGAGHPHAEVIALNQLSDSAILDATLYVTLEPCCHTGRTPPCTDLIITRQLARVIYGYQDPNPIVHGHGAALLKQQGITCELLPLPEIAAFYKSYQHWHKTQQPFITAKLALSADNKIAGPQKKPFQITSCATQLFTHEKRLRSDAILTSAETICRDDPQLNVRLNESAIKKSIYIIDRQLRIPLSARIFKTADNITIFHGANASRDKMLLLKTQGVKLHEIAYDSSNFLNLYDITNIIGKDGRHDVWLEAGAQMFQAFIQAGLVQQVYKYHAPIFLGKNAYAANLAPDLLEDFRCAQTLTLDQDKIAQWNKL